MHAGDRAICPHFVSKPTVPRTLERQPFLLAGNLFPAPTTLPEVVTERAAPPPLFGLAPHGVCPASAHYCRRGALLPHLFTLTHPRKPGAGGTFSVALSVKPALSEPPRPLAGMLPCGDRTFLPPRLGFPALASGCPSGRPAFIMGGAIAQEQGI